MSWTIDVRSITPSSPPSEYVQLRQTSVPIGGRQEFSTFVKDADLRSHLWNEQNGRCAYCECHIRHVEHPKGHNTKIEHFHPFETSSWESDCAGCSGATSTVEGRIEIRNLLLVCEGNEKNTMPTTCDTLKDNTDICTRFRNPKGRRGEMLVWVDKRGRAVAVPSLPDGAQEVVDSVLNLNADHLIEARMTILTKFKENYIALNRMRRGISNAEKERIKDQYRKLADEQEYSATYLSIANRLRPY